ncbi:MAG: sensor histidine kinase, partial [Deltaproteobacteria bacterium]|nr:sensor histidine kinase [Deltaproteobacteria bacterium]
EDEDLRKYLNDLKEDLSSWVDRAMSTNALFSYLADTENIEEKERFPAKKIVDEIKEQVKFLAKGVPIETSRIEKDLKLPNATLVEWGSILQNVFINAFNAMVDSDKKIIDVSSRSENGNHELLIQDIGVGVNLEDAESLFSPFVRKLVISPERRALGYGGTGLGLAIVDLIATNIECKASFVEPEKEFNTAFSLKWREKG